MNKNILTLLLSLFIFSFMAEAQSYNKKFGLEVNGGIREYHGDHGSAIYLQRSPDYQTVGGSFGIYLNPSFDLHLYGSVGDLGFYKTSTDYDCDNCGTGYTYRQGFTARITDAMLGITYKFANGYILAEDARVRPFLKAGWGAMQSVSNISHIRHFTEEWPKSRTWIASHWNAGLGFKIGLTETFDLVINEQVNYTFDDNYDGSPYAIAGAKLNSGEEGNKPLHDIYLAHTIGIVANFGDNGNSGYKVKDKDGDGVGDKYDLCPKTPEGYEVDSVGCPFDDDKDGVWNEDDKCPNTPGTVENQGCPENGADVLNEINLAAKGIYFETAKSIIKKESYGNLNRLALILNVYPDAKVSIEGHTDNQGDDDSNIKLSEERATAVMEYLTTKGVDKSRMTAKGLGEADPVTDNSTAEGRALNRRVDFKLTF